MAIGQRKTIPGLGFPRIGNKRGLLRGQGGGDLRMPGDRLGLRTLVVIPLLALLPLAAVHAAETQQALGIVPQRLVDGSYQGRAKLVLGKPGPCPKSRYGFVEIGDGTLIFPYTPKLVFQARVQPDGTVFSKLDGGELSGRTDGRHLDMTIKTPQCETHYHLHYIWNHS
jgi:hypothetical protein